MSESTVLADSLLDALLVGEDLEIPVITLEDPAFNPPSIVNSPLYTTVPRLTNADLTSGEVGGDGTYDAIMQAQSIHLKEEYEAGRITGAEYTKAYIALAQAAMGQAVQFLLGKDQAYWASINAQMQALTATVQLRTAKAQLAVALNEVKNQRVVFALNKLKLANEDGQYAIQKEQTQAARAQTADTRSDTGATIVGAIGKQKQLYDQQITSYQRSSQLNAGKVYSDAWIALKSIAEGTDVPTAFTVANINEVLSHIQTDNGLGDPT